MGVMACRFGMRVAGTTIGDVRRIHMAGGFSER